MLHGMLSSDINSSMGVKRGGQVGPLDVEILNKKGCFLVLSRKNKFNRI